MIYRVFEYECPLCGVSLVGPFTDEQVKNDTPVFRQACQRNGGGCGNPHYVKPSDGVEVPDRWDRLVPTVVL